MYTYNACNYCIPTFGPLCIILFKVLYFVCVRVCWCEAETAVGRIEMFLVNSAIFAFLMKCVNRF